MKILVYDVAAEDGGGIFVLNQFYQDALQHKDIAWHFIISADMKETANIKIEQHKKGSWLDRLAYEGRELPKRVNQLKPDLFISLQNMPFHGIQCPQLVYLHQSLQYCPKRFSFLKGRERGTAVRQHLICGMYKKALPLAEHIFVQTNWIKEATVRWLGCPKEKITVVPVDFDPTKVPVKPYLGQKSNVFFYPARAEMYKNHLAVIEACKRLKDEDYKVFFTITGDENEYARNVKEASMGLPIELIGQVGYQTIWDYYSKTILLFPSYLETCGLPLLEAKVAKGRIIATDLPYSHEALGEYQNAVYFRFDDPEELASRMRDALRAPQYYNGQGNERNQRKPSLVTAMLKQARIIA